MVLQKMASVSQDLNLSNFLGQILSLYDQTQGRFHFYPAWRSSDGSEKRQTGLERSQRALERGNRSVLSELGWAVTHLGGVLMRGSIILYSCISSCGWTLCSCKKQELIPMCWGLSLEMGRSGLNGYSKGWAGDKEAGRWEMSGLDTHSLLQPFEGCSIRASTGSSAIFQKFALWFWRVWDGFHMEQLAALHTATVMGINEDFVLWP